MRNPRTPPRPLPGTVRSWLNCLIVSDSCTDSSSDSLKAEKLTNTTTPDSSDSFSMPVYMGEAKSFSFLYVYKEKLSVTIKSLIYIDETVCKTVSELSELSLSGLNAVSGDIATNITHPPVKGPYNHLHSPRAGATPIACQLNALKNWVVRVVRVDVWLSQVNAHG